MQRELRSAFNPRQYMLSKDFEIFYYSDLHFKSVGDHSHDYYEFYLFVEGDMTMEIAGTEHELRSGDVILIPPGTVHRAIIHDGSIPYRRFVFWVTPGYVQGLMEHSPDYGYLFRHVAEAQHYVHHYDVISFNALRGKLFSLLDEIRSDRFGRDTRIDLCVRELLLHLNRTVYEADHPRTGKENLSTYEAITAFIDAHMEEELSLDRLAGEFFLSKFYIAHLFQDSTGLSLHQYITKKRLSICCDAIRGGASIGEAHTLCGFKDYSSFFRAFKKEYGVSPAEFKRLYAG